MSKKNAAKKTATNGVRRFRFDFRFADDEHHNLVTKAAKCRKQSINAWLVDISLEAAKQELKK